MSDPVIKGAKRSSSRPAPHSAAPKAPAKGRKLTTEAAKPKPKRAAAAKPPVRKAAPAKSSSSGTKSNKTARPAAKQPAAAKTSKKPAAPKSAPASKAGAKSHAAPSPSKAAPAKKVSAPVKAQPAKGAPTKLSKPTATAAARPAPRPAPAQPRQPSRDEAAALKAFERAHKDFTRGNFAAAREHFRALIEQHAGVSEVAARARTYLNIAETRLRSEAALPRDPDSLYDRGVIELNRGDFVAAQELFERALKRDHDAADTHYALAAARARLGAVESALQALERAVELRPVLRVRAQADADLALLRNDPEFERIVFPNSRP
jgi:tetratricopeptide (TPR) repeat protein